MTIKIKHICLKIIGIANYSENLQTLCIKYATLRIIISAIIMLSFAWISLWYLRFLSFAEFGLVTALGMITGIILDYPLGLLTDRTGVKKSFIGSLILLSSYYFGMIFAQTFFHFLILHLIIGVYYALFSGTISSWFMNTWEIHGKDEDIGGAWANINFLNSLTVSFIIFCGGLTILMFGSQNISNLFVYSTFTTQAIISLLCVMLAYWWMDNKQSISQKKKNIEQDKSFKSKLHQLTGANFLAIIIIFSGISLMFHTVISFDEFIVAPVLFQIFMVTVFYISSFRSGNKFSNSIFSRLSAKFTSKYIWREKEEGEKKKRTLNAFLLFISINFCIIWLLFAIILFLKLPIWFGLLLFLIVYYLRSILIGLSQSVWFQVYYQIMDSERRPSQESLFNTLHMLTQTIGFIIIGVILNIWDFASAFLFLAIAGLVGFLLLSTVISKHYHRKK